MNPTKTGVELGCSGRGKKSLKIPKGKSDKPYIEEEQTTCNGQKKKYKRTNNDRQNIHIKLKIE